jgi:HEAT repeat protein
MAQKGTLSNLQLAKNLEDLLVLMDKVTGSLEQKDRDYISQNIGKTIATMDKDIIQQLRSQDMEQLFDGMLLQHIVGELDEVKPEDKSVELNTSNAVISTENISSADAANQEKTDNQGSGSVAGSEKADYQKHLLNLKEKLSLRLKDNKRPFMNAPLLFVLPKIIEQLTAQKDEETLEKIITRLVADLLHQNADIRAQASKGLIEVIESFSPDRQSELIEGLSGQLMEWIKLETVVTPAYKKICKILNDLIYNFIRQGRLAELIPILDVFNYIHAGILEKNDAVHDISSEIIRNLASDENLAILFKELNANEKNKQDEAGQILISFGDVILSRLLDIVRDVADSDERVRIMRLIIGMGQRAIPGVRDRINKNTSWYYLRNLAYILGHIGNEASAGDLHPLLLHENERVRLQALKSIYQIGGNQRGPLLLSALPLADDQFKLNIIETLGNAKCVDAVPNLLDLLKKLPLLASPLQIDLQEKICIALGSIGSPEAIPTLSRIAKPKSFFRLRSCPVKVKNAAGRALISIRKKQEEAGNPGS